MPFPGFANWKPKAQGGPAGVWVGGVAGTWCKLGPEASWLGSALPARCAPTASWPGPQPDPAGVCVCGGRGPGPCRQQGLLSGFLLRVRQGPARGQVTERRSPHQPQCLTWPPARHPPVPLALALPVAAGATAPAHCHRLPEPPATQPRALGTELVQMSRGARGVSPRVAAEPELGACGAQGDLGKGVRPQALALGPDPRVTDSPPGRHFPAPAAGQVPRSSHA